MELMTIIYFIDIFAGDPIPFGGIGAFILLLIFCVLGGLLSFLIDEGKKEGSEIFSDWIKKWTSKTAYTVYAVILFAWGINALIPSKDTAYKMLAAYGVTEIATNERVQELGGKSLEVLEKAMNDYLEKSKKTGEK